MPFYVVGPKGTVVTEGSETEGQCRRDAVRIIGDLSFEAVAALPSSSVDGMWRSLNKIGYRLRWSAGHQYQKKQFNNSVAGV